eukprot:scaffold170052_cov43-Attheya_sp.AAC.1
MAEVGDTVGFGVAIQMLIRSQDNGKRTANVQFDTVRKLVSGYSNCYHASAKGTPELFSLSKDKKKSFFTKCETYCPWNEKFRKGCVKRMGQESRQDRALPMGKPARARDYEMYIMDALAEIQIEFPELIGKEIDVYEDVGVSRTLRRTAATQAQAMGVSAEDIDRMNRWRSVENAAGRTAHLRMRDHYADIRLMVKGLLRFSQAL